MDRRVSVVAFIISVAYVPGITGMTIPTGWAAMSLTLPFATWRELPTHSLHVVGAGFLCYACASLAWAPSPLFGIFHLWQLGCIALAFILGGQLRDLRPIMYGLGIGVTISSGVCIAQWFGYSPVLMNWQERPSGLMYNSVAMGTTAGIVFVWLIAQRVWWLAIGVLPSVVLTQSRGTWIAVAAVALLSRSYWFGLVILACVVGLFVFGMNPGDVLRMALWVEAGKRLTISGAGAGAIESVYLNTGEGGLISPEYLHSEPLDFLFHFGIAGLAAIALLIAPLLNIDKPEWYPYAGFFVMSLYSFPLHISVAAFAGAVLAGHLCRDWALVWNDFNRRRLGFFTRSAYS